MGFMKGFCFGFALVAVIGISGCSGDAESEPVRGINLNQKRMLLEEVEFELPGQDDDIPHRFYAPSKVAWEGKIVVEPFHLKTGKWQVWYTGNVWSSATERESAAERNNKIGLVLSKLKDFEKLNKLDFEINFLQTDGVSAGLGMSFAGATKGWSMHGGGGGCTPFFLYCVNNFVVAPFDADGKSESAGQYEWLRPYSKLTKVRADRMSGHKGYEDKSSKYWTLTPSAAFIVNPDGIVVDAFIPLLSDLDPSSGNIISALIREMGIDTEDLVYPTEGGSLFADQPDKLVYFGGDYAQEFLTEFERILKR